MSATTIRELKTDETSLASPAVLELCPDIGAEGDFTKCINTIQRAEGYRLVASFIGADACAVAVSGFRLHHNLCWAGEAEDAVLETMLIAWRKWATVENPTTWLTRDCVNLRIRRRRMLKRWLLLSRDEWPTEQSQLPDLEGRMHILQHGDQHLSPPQGAMVALHVRDGLTVNECAAMLGCRPGTARSHLGRAMKTLRKESGGA